jgi:hypothetical protein
VRIYGYLFFFLSTVIDFNKSFLHQKRNFSRLALLTCVQFSANNSTKKRMKSEKLIIGKTVGEKKSLTISTQSQTFFFIFIQICTKKKRLYDDFYPLWLPSLACLPLN